MSKSQIGARFKVRHKTTYSDLWKEKKKQILLRKKRKILLLQRLSVLSSKEKSEVERKRSFRAIDKNIMEKNDEISICDEMLPAIKTIDSDAKDNDLNQLKSNADSDKLTTTTTTATKTKYDAKMADDDKCINNQDICKNIKNVNTNNKTDCNVVIDDDTQSKQQQQQSQPPSPSPLLPPPSQPPTLQQTYGCVHYKRKAKFVVSQTEIKIHSIQIFLLLSLRF